mgnify:CR=1 FL=1
MAAGELIGNLVQISNQKYAIFEEILDLTNSQTGAIASEDFELLGNLIQEKQKRITQVEPLDEQFNSLYSKLKEELGVSSMEQLTGNDVPGITELKNIISKLLEIIDQISEVEKRNNDSMKTLLENNKKQIKDVVYGKKALLAYSNKSYESPSYFIDKKK